jgi:methionyl-tRNA formyltransferase
VLDAYAASQPDLCVMAFVTHILPARVLSTPRLGSIQYHPSLLPRHRGRSAIHWAIRHGDHVTGVTIFWVDEGIDTGPVLLQRQVEIAPDDTVGSLYFDKLYPLGVDGIVESVRLVREGVAPRLPQDESQAIYDPPADDSNSAIEWSRPAIDVYNLVRGSNPQPGAHARLRGETVRVFDARIDLRDTDTPPGTVVGVTDDAIEIALQGGVLRALRLQAGPGKKISAAEFARERGVQPADRFEDGPTG